MGIQAGDDAPFDGGVPFEFVVLFDCGGGVSVTTSM
jgi:hypothetical protein